MTSLEDLRGALADPGWPELAATGPIERAFAVAGRVYPAEPLAGIPGWTAVEAARALLLAALPPDRAAEEAETVYRHGDAGEKLAVLKALPLLSIGDAALPLLRDALRTNDTRLVSAALGPYAAHLDDAAWRQGVLKCVFMGVPLSDVHGMAERADRELATMLDAFAQERRAAGREVPPDALAVLERVKEA